MKTKPKAKKGQDLIDFASGVVDEVKMPRVAMVGLRIAQLQARRSSIQDEAERLETLLATLEAEESSINEEQHELLREMDRLASAKKVVG